MKSLEKDRARRYETANGLAEDIRRHLEHEPVLARSPSTTYRLHKFLRRHRAHAITAVAFGVLIALVVAVLSIWNRDRLQLAEAEGFRHRGILSQAREQYAKADREAALETIKPILHSKHVGPEAQLLHAGILVDNRRSDEAVTVLGSLLNERPEIAGAAHSLLARILWESESPNAEKLKEIDEHRQRAEALLPETAEAYFLRAMTAITIKEQLASLDRALQIDPGHYESRRLRAFTYYASRKYERMKDDAMVLTVVRPRDPLGYSLHAIAWRELGRYPEAIADYDIALALTPKDSPAHTDLSTQRSETLLQMGDYERVITEALIVETQNLASPPHTQNPETQNLASLRYHVFCALTALGDYEKADALFRQIVRSAPTSRNEFQHWSMKHVFGTLEAGRSWHPVDREPAGAAFLSMVEAEETYRDLSAKGRRVTTDGFNAHWSPDGSKLAFSQGVHGRSGVATFDLATRETELLIVPGKDPKWSPDGRHIAFVRDRQTLRLEELATAERKDQARWVPDEEVWIMNADGTEPRWLARGGWPSWSQDSACIYYQSRMDYALCSISIEGRDGEPKRIMACSNPYPSVSPDNQRVAYLEGTSLKVKDLASQALDAERPVPFATWGGAAWSPTGRELCLGGRNDSDDRTGLWVYSLDRSEPVRTLGGQITAGSWAPDGTKLVFCLGPPYYEIWVADLDRNISAIEALGPGQTLDEHFREMLALYTRRIEADPLDAYAHSSRAQYNDYLHDREKANADMRQYSAILSQGSSSDLQLGTSRDLMRVIHGPFGYRLVFSVERRKNGTQVLCVAFGQKGRSEMKLFEIPMFVMSLAGFWLVSSLDSPAAYADFTFGEPVNLKSVIPVIDPAYDMTDCLSYDGLEMYIESVRPGGSGDDIWVLRRDSIDEDWGPPVNLGPTVNSSAHEVGSAISSDGLTLYFQSTRPGGYGNLDAYMTTRVTKNAPWGPAVNLGSKVNTSADDGAQSVDDLELYMVSNRPGGYGGLDFYVARRATVNDRWGDPVNLGPVVNSAYQEWAFTLSPDGLVLLFSDHPDFGTPRPGGYGGMDMWMTRRATLSDPWQAPVNLGPRVNSSITDFGARISPDGRMLYFSTRGSTWDNWQAPILPVVDFNADGIVDLVDLVMLIDNWGTNKTLCDIGPMPWGDGKVDAEDLKVFMEHWGQEIPDPTLVAHWKLDEAQGITAADSVGSNHGTLVGDPAWQPSGGKLGGALLFDGVGDCVNATFVLDPAAGPFSVIAWVKGGATGRVIVSQASGADWLYLNQYGMLTTGLNDGSRNAKSLSSDAFVTDDQWHRVVLAWDGTNRTLQMDGVEVARDTQPNLAASSGSLHIGAGKYLGTTTFWSGLIDDVRIYNRAVTP